MAAPTEAGSTGLSSDLRLDASKFDPRNYPKQTQEFNEQLFELLNSHPRWYNIGAAKYREMRLKGETQLPIPVLLESGVNITVPSREEGREIPCRMFKPESGISKGVFMHVHGGGWVLQSEAYQDGLLKWYADHFHLTVISIGYRLAPEHPFPAGPEDCVDAAAHLAAAPTAHGGPLRFIGGESAGAHLSILTALHFLDLPGGGGGARARAPFPNLQGLVLHFGNYDLSGLTPSVHHFGRPLVLDRAIITRHLDVVVPGLTPAQRRHPSISPLYADLVRHRGALPPALFTCGSEDPLLDDSVFMAAKWQMAGAEAVLKVFPGAPHGYINHPLGTIESVEQGLQATKRFVEAKLA